MIYDIFVYLHLHSDDPLEQPTTAQYLWTAALTMTPLRYTSDLWEYLYYGESPSTSCPYRDNMATSVRNK